MNCNCPDETYVQSEVDGKIICTKTTETPSACPEGCTEVVLPNGDTICRCIDEAEPQLGGTLKEVELTDTEYFEDVSFTLAYSLNTNSWISFYDFKPNYYVSHNDYFQTGVNETAANSEIGLWSHLLTNRSYGVFYGNKYEVGLEYPIINTYQSKTLESVEIWADGGRYHNELDYAYERDIIFNKFRVFNRKEASGNLELVPQKVLSDVRRYPKTTGNTQKILATNSNNRWNVNYIFNRILYEGNNQPIMNWDNQQITKTFNDKIVKFKGKKVLEPMRGEFFLVYLGYDLDSRYVMEFKWATNKEDLT